MLDALKKAFSQVVDSFKGHEVGVVKRTLAKVVRINLSPEEIDKITENVFFDLLEADVPYEIAEQIKERLKQELAQRTFSDKYKEEVRQLLREILKEFLQEGKLEIGRKPFVILFVGPNGYGKTSTIVKLAYLLKPQYDVGIVGADTFRAAAREQASLLAQKAGVDFFTTEDKKPVYVIKKGLEHFKQKDVILVDTAGRQEMNYNLMKELEAIYNHIPVDFTFYILESTAGNAAYDQIQEYKRFAKVNGVILTKLDLDAKGGAIFAPAYYGIPIYYITKGQSLEDIEPFDKERFVREII